MNAWLYTKDKYKTFCSNDGTTYGVMRLMSVEEPQPAQVGLPSVISMRVHCSPLKPHLPGEKLVSEKSLLNALSPIRTSLKVAIRSSFEAYPARARGNYLRDTPRNSSAAGEGISTGDNLTTNDQSGLRAAFSCVVGARLWFKHTVPVPHLTRKRESDIM